MVKLLYLLNIQSGAMNVLILQCCVFFFLSVYTRKCRNNASIQTLKVVSNSKMNLVGTLGRSFFEFPNSFQKCREKPKKIKEKREFLRKTSF
ncbi:Uncharacterized protein FWK35_00034881 [Aphis craccivora]|uniref:Uncharacterized protein n=1 Tax=Aphis craccivora TaxID=307492 RepID=A0A6G0Y1K9_APHCR|nr:Uncharacterized protein FWK35_00034881 [Aphis craccivora]